VAIAELTNAANLIYMFYVVCAIEKLFANLPTIEVTVLAGDAGVFV
jgi:hypothetical protein